MANRTTTHRGNFANGVIAFICLAAIATGGCNAKPVIPASAPFTLEMAARSLVDAAQPRLNSRKAEGTDIVRVDREQEILLRFSVRGRDNTVRLVAVTFHPSDGGRSTSVLITSQLFSFLRRARRDAVDVEIEDGIASLLRGIAVHE